MTLDQLKKVNPTAYEEWLGGNQRLTARKWRETTRAYKVNGRLFIVWNNGAFYESFYWTGSEWKSHADGDWQKTRPWRAKYYQEACRTLSRYDRIGLYE